MNMQRTATTFRIGNVKCSTHSIADLLAEIRHMLDHRADQPRDILFVNAHVANLAQDDAGLCQRLNAARVVAADGMALVWAGRLLGAPMRERCNMTDAFRAFLQDQSFPGTSAALLGGTMEEAERAAREINRVSRHMRVTRCYSGFLPPEEYARALSVDAEPDFVLLGMGTPKSEQTGAALQSALPHSILWHIGGGTVMFYAATLREAPAWMRRVGLQWLHRLALEPGRMWRRYLLGNPRFVLHVLRSCFAGRGRD